MLAFQSYPTVAIVRVGTREGMLLTYLNGPTAFDSRNTLYHWLTDPRGGMEDGLVTCVVLLKRK